MGRRFIADESGLFSCELEVSGRVLSEAIEHDEAEEVLRCVLNAALAVLAEDEPWTYRFLDCMVDFMLTMRDHIDREQRC